MPRFFFTTGFFLVTGFFALAQQNEIYINKVWTFQGNSEFYIPLQLSDSIEIENPFQFLSERLDSVIANDTYITRKRLPFDVAEKFFDLQTIQKIRIYSSDHKLITSATFVRVEYFEDMIEGMFIAVFKTSSSQDFQLEEVDLYCISENAASYLQNIKCEEVVKKQWDEKIKEKIYFDQDNLLTIKHYEVKLNSSEKYTLLSLQNPDSFESTSFLIEQVGSQLKILKRLEKDIVIWDLLPIPISHNYKPVFLVETVIPDTDYTSYTLAVFNGSSYDFFDNMKLKK